MKFDTQEQKDLVIALVANAPVTVPAAKLTEVSAQVQAVLAAMYSAEVEPAAWVGGPVAQLD